MRSAMRGQLAEPCTAAAEPTQGERERVGARPRGKDARVRAHPNGLWWLGSAMKLRDSGRAAMASNSLMDRLVAPGPDTATNGAAGAGAA